MRARVSVAIIAILYWPALSVLGQSPSPSAAKFVTLQYPNSQLSDVVAVYASLSGRTVWVQWGID